MAWSITSAGTINSSAGNSFSLSSLSIPAGSLIVVGVQESNLSGGTVGSVTDSSLNSYTLITQRSPNNSAGQGGVGVFYFNNNAATVTSITYTRAGSVGDNALISVSWITGQAASPLDTAVTASAGGSSTTPSVTSGAPSVSGELLIGWWGTSFSSVSFTQDTGHGWTSTGGLASASGNTCGAGGNQVTGSATTFAPTTGNAPWAVMVVGFKPASPIINVNTSLPPGQALSGPGSYPVQLRWLANMPAPVFIQPPFNQLDWPIYKQQLSSAPTWLWNNTRMIGQDKLPPGESLTDLPVQPIYPIQLRTLINTAAPAPVTIIGPPGVLWNQYSWPVPTAPYRMEQTWLWKYNLNLIGQDKFPPGEMFTALPIQPVYPVQLRTLINTTAPAAPAPGGPPGIVWNQYSWPLPQYPSRLDQTWTYSFNLNLISQDQLPPGENLTGGQNANAVLPQWPDMYPVQLRSSFGGPPPGAPVTSVGPWQLVFNQFDWPLTPEQARSISLRSWIQGANLALNPPPVTPGPLGKVFNQYSWPLTPAAQRDISLSTWINRTVQLLGLDKLPVRQQDWPLPPRGPAPIDQFIGEVSIFAPPPPVFVGAQYFLLQPHYIFDRWIPAFTIVTEGREIPFGWTPTLMADPLNTPAVYAFYNAGPRVGYPGPGFDWQGFQPTGPAIQSPKTFWVQSSPGKYKLTGLGAAFPPVGE